MRRVLWVMGVVWIAGCAAARPGQGASGPRPEPAAPASGARAADDGQADAEASVDPPPSYREALVGAWVNRSCGERKYLRRFDFQADGRFLAVDELAPCPDGEQCVSTGVVEWRGSWRIEGRVVQLEITPVEGAKPPENPPTDFVVVGEEPFSVGERNDKLVCAYTKQ